MPRSRSASAPAETGFRGLELRFEIDELELGQRALLDQASARFQFGPALVEQRARLRNLRLACVVGQDRDHLALLHLLAALDLQFGQHAAGARRQCHLAVGFGTPERTSLRLCGTTDVSMTATRNSFSFVASGRTAARLSAVSCGMRGPDSTQRAAAATRPIAVTRLAFISISPRPSSHPACNA
jgi:hypothetical protein